MEQKLLEQLNKWHEEDQFQTIIDTIENIEEQDYETICHLARAYNNRGEEGDYDRAVELLQMVSDMGKDDPLWHYRMGYAAFYSGRYEQAEAEFAQVLELDPDEEDAIYFIHAAREQFIREQGEIQEEFSPEVYEEEDLDILEDFIADTFGEFDSIFHEIISPDIHVDICLIPPEEGREFYTLVTLGMGAHLMNVPEDLLEYDLQRAELLICLPADWKLDSDDERWYWPIRLLKILARLPMHEDTWLGWGHTIDHGACFDESTELCGSILINPAAFGDIENVCELSDGGEVNFYQVIPLYREEMDFKMAHDAKELLQQMDSRALIVDPKRYNYCTGKDILS